MQESEAAEVKSLLMRLCPDSALTKHGSGRQRSSDVQVSEQYFDIYKENAEISAIMLHMNDSTIMAKLAAIPLPDVDTKIASFYNQVVAVTAAKAADLAQLLWMQERQHRITGTTCYQIYIYKKGDWKKKAQSTFHSPFRGNSATRHGLETQAVARHHYAAHMQATVITTGLLVSDQNLCLGCTPDGVVIEDGVPVRLLEIKCPANGKTHSIAETLGGCNSLMKHNEEWLLKKKHCYYGQVQLCMSILNASHCDFMILQVQTIRF